MALFNVFSDPKLVARQAQLDAQWNSLWASFQACDATPDSAFSEFVTDRNGWKTFFDSGSDWSSDSKRATDDWQTKAQDWSNRLQSWGCTGNEDSAPQPGSSGIPSVKDPPPDEPGIIDEITGVAKAATDKGIGWIETIGWVALGLAVLIIVAIVYLGTHSKVETPGLKVG